MKTCFITGTDTGAGKTVLTALLARYLHQFDVRVAALKPVCSGGRADAEQLFAALDGTLPMDVINPWHFRAAIAPVLAARREKRTVTRADLLRHLRQAGQGTDVVLVEGAGGLLSPLGEQVNSLDLIQALRARVILVAPNQLGVVNHILLTLKALPARTARSAQVVLMSPPQPDPATASNAALLAEFFPAGNIFKLPWLGKRFAVATAVKRPAVRRVLQELATAALLVS